MKILLAVDGSPCSRKAEAAIRSLPLPGPLQLKVVTVCPSGDLHAISSVPETIQEMVDQCRRQSQALVEQVAERCREWCPCVETELLDGHPPREVVLAADRCQADVIVVGARGQGAVSRFFLGSVSDGIATQAHCSVLVVRHDAGETCLDQHPVQKILIPYDGSSTSAAAVTRVAGWDLTEAHSVLVRAVIERAPYLGLPVAVKVYEELRAELEPQLRAVAEPLLAKTAKVNKAIHIAANAADDIIDAAASHSADLVVIGNTGKSAWERMLLGSVTSRVLHHVHCSVWIERRPAST